MAILTTPDNLGKYAVKNGRAYEGRIGFDSNGNTTVKWYQITGHRGCQIDSLYRSGKRIIFGRDVIAI